MCLSFVQVLSRFWSVLQASVGFCWFLPVFAAVGWFLSVSESFCRCLLVVAGVCSCLMVLAGCCRIIFVRLSDNLFVIADLRVGDLCIDFVCNFIQSSRYI